MRPKPRPRRVSKLDTYTEYIDLRMGEGLENCRVLDREIHAWAIRVVTRQWCSTYARGGDGVSRRRRCGLRRRRESRRKWTGAAWHTSTRTGSTPGLGVRDDHGLVQCHVDAFEYLSGVPRRCLYDNAKVITLGRDEEKRPIWNQRMLDFARRVGFEARLCQPYRAQTKGKVENGVKYVRRNMWPSIRFTTASSGNWPT